MSGMFTDGSQYFEPGKPEQDNALSRAAYKQKVQETFTPTSVAKGQMYLERNDFAGTSRGSSTLQNKIENVVCDENKQLFIYGDSGVGKTNLILNVCDTLGINYVLIPVASNQTISSAFDDALIEVGADKVITAGETRNESFDTRAGGAAVPGRLFSAKVENSTSNEREERYEHRTGSAQLILLKELLKKDVELIIFDNIQNFEDEDIKSLGSVMEYFSSYQHRDAKNQSRPRIAAVGIYNVATKLVDGNESRARRIERREVPHMSDVMIKKIAEKGFRELKLECGPEALQLIAFYSDGFPYFTHKLCLDIALRDDVYDKGIVAARDIEESLESIVSEMGDDFGRAVALARGSRNTKRKVRSRVLEAVVNENWPTWRVNDVERAIREGDPQFELKPGVVASSLNSLCESKYGGLLAKEGKNRDWTYRFKDPHYRPAIRAWGEGV